MKNLANMVKYGQKMGFWGPNNFLKNIGSVLTSFHTFLEHLEGCLIFFEFPYAKMPVSPTVPRVELISMVKSFISFIIQKTVKTGLPFRMLF